MDLKMDLKNRFRASIRKTSIAAQERLCNSLSSLPYREVDPDTNDLVALFDFLSSEELEDSRLSEFKVKYPLIDLNLIHERLKESPELWKKKEKKKEKWDLEEEKRELEEVKRKLKEYEQQWLEEERIWELETERENLEIMKLKLKYDEMKENYRRNIAGKESDGGRAFEIGVGGKDAEIEMERGNLEMSKSKQLLEEWRILKLEYDERNLEMSKTMEKIRKLKLKCDEGKLEMSKSMEKRRKLKLEYDEMKENYRRNAGKESDRGTD